MHRGPEEFLTAAVAFIEDGVAAGEPTIAILPNPLLKRLRARLGSNARRARLEDMAAVGRNPARILPLLYEFVQSNGGRPQIIEQPLWRGRSEAEVAEVLCHEALVNRAFADTDVQLLCAYDVETTDRPVLADARRTHPQLVSLDGARSASPDYVAPFGLHGDLGAALEEPRPPVEEIPVTRELRSLRQRVASSAVTASLPGSRREDLVLAVNEAAINALEYGHAPESRGCGGRAAA